MTQTSKQILKAQEQQADRERQQRQKPATQPKPAPQSTAIATKPAETLPAVPDARTSVERYIDEIAPSMVVGSMIKFTREGKHAVSDTGEEIGPDEDFVALVDQTLVGHTKFDPDGGPPERRMGLLYSGFVATPTDKLPDRDPAQWPLGLSGAPEDPWKNMIYLVLQRCSSNELYTFVTQSKTGRRAVGNLLRHYDRMRKVYPGEYPVVKLKTGGFQPRDQRLPWTHVPVFVVVGRAPADSAVKPDTSLGAQMEDSIPF